jgi:tRNA G46 methylase TrmB
MTSFSRPVSSSQQGTHPRLPELLARHRLRPWREPLASHNAEAIDSLQARLHADTRPLVLDSFCGTGQSTRLLSARYPGCLVIGIDKSAHRLARHDNAQASDYLLLQADCEPIWRFLADSGQQLHAHYLLYPNPWPKPGHLQRRVHGHPAFPLLLALGGRIELRSNWQLYAEEFGLAMNLSGRPGRVQRVDASTALSLFERKYRDSGHALWAFIGEPAM